MSHVERMKTEHKELSQKLQDLNRFIYQNELFKSLEDIEQIAMIQQAGFMKSYLDTLASRLWRAHE